MDECTHEGHPCLLATRWYPCEPQVLGSVSRLRSVSVGLAPQKPRLAGVKLVFKGFFCAYKPIYMHCTLLHNGGRSTVWYAYPKEERAVFLRDPLLFNLPCRGGSDSASAGRVPAEAQLTTDKGVNGRWRTFFFAVLKMWYICPSK